jgi:hypothetical protein
MSRTQSSFGAVASSERNPMIVTTPRDVVSADERTDVPHAQNDGVTDSADKGDRQEPEHDDDGKGSSDGNNDGSKEEREAEESSGQRP